MSTQLYYSEKPKRTPITEQPDVVVIGGGLTGVMAAVESARSGLSTLLIESKACLGGVATMGLPIQGYFNNDNQRIVAGLAEEFRTRLIGHHGAENQFTLCNMHNSFLIVNPEVVKLVCQEMLKDAGVKFLLHTFAVDADVNDDAIQAIFIEGKSGREAITAKIFIDCSGDADIAARAGVPYDIGSDKHGVFQSATLNFRMENVNLNAVTEALISNPEKYDLFELLPPSQFKNSQRHIVVGFSKVISEMKDKQDGKIDWKYICYITLLDSGSVCINTVHVKDKLACDTRELTDIETEGRAMVPDVVGFLKKNIPGFENAYMSSTAGWSGIRESRRIKGICRLGVDDIINGTIPDTSVALGGYPIDIHTPDNNSLIFKKVPTYGIPYGCMVPENITNLLVAGRCISVTHEALASTRLMAQCMALGQAAGAAAALCIQTGTVPRKLSVNSLRDKLVAEGAIVDRNFIGRV